MIQILSDTLEETRPKGLLDPKFCTQDTLLYIQSKVRAKYRDPLDHKTKLYQKTHCIMRHTVS